MQKLKNRVISGLMALMMMLGIILSSVGTNAQVADPAETEKTKVVIHKIKLDDLNGWPKSPQPDGTIDNGSGKKYDGNMLNVQEYFGATAEELSNVEFTYWKITKEQYEEMSKNPANYKTVELVENYLTETEKTTKKSGLTTANGLEIPDLVDGYYWFVENLGSQLKDPHTGKTLSKAAAVPFGLELPIYKADGSRFNNENALHVYPKNTLSEKPKTDKNFDNNNYAEDINLDNNQIDKANKDVYVGQVVPYIVATEIPAFAQYKTAYWNDQMTEGLTFNNDIKVTIGDAVVTANTHYTVVTDGNGFKVTLTEEGLKLINDKENTVLIKIQYTATVNDKAIVDIPESNDVTFHYGNNPSKGNTPKPNKPNENGEIKVEKTWASGEVPENVNAVMVLKNAQTGQEVGRVTLPQNDAWTHTWTGLDKNIEYKIEEVFNGYTPEYIISNEAGKTEVKNHKEDNPEPQNPSEPKVVTGGKRFQKVDAQTKEGLAGAEFYITNENGTKYLAKKTGETKVLEQAAYVAAEKAYKDAVKENTQTAEKIAELKATRDAAYVTVNTQWEWVDAKDNAFVVRSGTDGYFKVTGLAYGEYKLEEKTPPTGYAKITPVPFTVSANSTEATTLNTGKLDDNGLKQIDNKKISIPQTGGMGTVIFTMTGITLMGAAAFAMKRRKEEQ